MSESADRQGESSFSPTPVVTEGLAEELFAAVRAAIDPERRALQHDVLVSGVVELLYLAPDQTVAELTTASQSLWRTKAISEPLVERALHIAREGSVATVAQDLHGVDRWRLTEPARLIAQADHSAGVHVVNEFTRQIGELLDGQHDDRVDSRRAEKVTRIIVSALAEAMKDLYEVDGGLARDRLRPVYLDVGEVVTLVRKLAEPRSLRDAAVEIAVAAVDPDDPFGNDVVQLLTVGMILHGFASRRDLPGQPSANGHRIVLDTSVLVGLVAPAPSLERRVVEAAIRRSIDAGVEVVVPEHVIGEWERLFDAAEGEVAATSGDLGAATRLVSNPFARQYLMSLEEDARLEWRQFASRHRDVRRLLVEAGVRVRASGNNDQESARLAKELSSGLYERSRVARGRPRSRANCDADGNSLAMVHRWRKRAGATSAYFVSRGAFPGRVYGDITNNTDVPIEINPEAWLLYLATICTDDPAEKSRVAEMVAASAIRASFFGIAASYTVEDAVALARRLTDNGGPATIEDSRAALQLDLLGLFEETEPDRPSNERKVSAVVQRRQARATTRLAREQADLDATIASVQRDADGRVSAEKQRAETAEHDAQEQGRRADQEQRSATFWRRLGVGALPVIAVVVVGLVLTATGSMPTLMLLVLIGGASIYGSQLYGYATDPTARPGPFIAKVVADIGGIALVELGVGLLLK